MIKPPHDPGIPLLTEVIPPPQLKRAADRVAQPAAPASPPPAVREALPASAAPVPDSAEWNRLERQISERVLQQMMGRIDFVLEQRVRDSLADVLQIAVTGLAGEIRAGLQQTLEEVITRAVTQEVSRLQSNKK